MINDDTSDVSPGDGPPATGPMGPMGPMAGSFGDASMSTGGDGSSDWTMQGVCIMAMCNVYVLHSIHIRLYLYLLLSLSLYIYIYIYIYHIMYKLDTPTARLEVIDPLTRLEGLSLDLPRRIRPPKL